MNSIVRTTLLAVALLGLSCGVAVAQTTTHATGFNASTQHVAHMANIVKCKNPAECSVPR